MLPRWHIILGAALTIILWYAIPEISLFYLSLVFFSSFLIDFDHYVTSAMKTKKLGIKDSYQYYRDQDAQVKKDLATGIRRKCDDFHLFHTVEFHTFVGLLGIFWIGFFYIFIGMLFHSMLDVISLLRGGVFHRREYFFFNWVKRKRKKN
jgi:hypothetical protein